MAVPPDRPYSTVDPETLTVLAAVCRDHEQLRFDYRTHDGSTTSRLAEPYRLVTWGRRWYLLAWDVDRRDWHTVRELAARYARAVPAPPGGRPH